MSITKVTSALVDSLDATKLTGTIADARISAGSVTQHVDLTAVRQDIAMLALYNAVSDNRAAYNLPYSFIDQFEDDTGLTTQTNVDRDATGEYVSSTSPAPGNDANTLFLMEPDATNGATTFTDISAASATITGGGGLTHSTTQNKFGATSIYFAGNDYLTIPTRSDFDWGTGGAFTVDAWVFCTNWSGFGQTDGKLWDGGGDDHRFGFKGSGATMGGEGFGSNWTTHSMSNDTWYHIAWVRHTDGSARMYVGGSELHTQTGNTENFDAAHASIICIGDSTSRTGGEDISGFYLGGLRVSNVDRTKDSDDPMYIATGTSYTVPTDYYGGSVFNATGTLISDTQTAPSATTKMSGVILYKDNAGTATLGTDLVISLSANGGTNWTEAASYGTVTPLFSTGIKMVRLGETTVTSGTTPVIKAVWANQVSTTMETQLHGWAMNYQTDGTDLHTNWLLAVHKLQLLQR